MDRKTKERIETEYFVALQRLERERGLPAPTGVDPAVCLRHNWRPHKKAWWIPWPRESQCPGCLAEHDVHDEGPPIYVDGYVPRREWRGELSPRHELLIDRNRERSNGGVFPGSDAERDALERIDELRANDTHNHKGVPTFQKIERGELVTYVDTRRSIRQRPKLVRARP
jgi:hypothetical protein